jgi:inorganic pyrophosphatase
MNLTDAQSDHSFFNVVIETPRGSRSKFSYDEKTGNFLLKKFLPAGTSFPTDVGFIPHTRSGDGDPLDVFVLMEGIGFPGCIIKCRVIGMLEVEQESGYKSYRNDRVLAIPTVSHEYDGIREITDLGEEVNEIVQFCRYYNEMEGKRFSVTKMLNSHDAIEIIKKNYITSEHL